mmetsp:Transcript_47919/g.143111  ORF Transcript_47919/g.143111 Transcript_47919/m.143111 type:complete len:304 (-) Transcript_47919:398-1309(-)
MSNHRRPHVHIQRVINNAVEKLSNRPVLAMSVILSRFVEKTIALGGVATGSMKAQLAASVAGTMSVTGWAPTDRASSPMMGSRTFAVAVLLVTSVRKVTTRTTKRTSSTVGKSRRRQSWSPIQADKWVSLNPVARAKPPPKRRRMSQGVFNSVCQSISRVDTPRSSLAGMMKRRIAAAIEMVLSSIHPLGRCSATTTGFRHTHARTVAAKTRATLTSAWLRRPNLLARRASRTGWLAPKSARGILKTTTRYSHVRTTIISARGAAKPAHPANGTRRLNVLACAARTPFGGVPMIVPMPPMLAE